jgi:hypothetical protein
MSAKQTVPLHDLELQRDETVLWAGRPVRGIQLRLDDVLISAATLGAFAFIVTETTRRSVAEDVPANIIVMSTILFPLLYVGLLRYVVIALERARMRYVVTNQRILVLISRPGGTQVISRKMRYGIILTIRSARNNVGTLSFCRLEASEGKTLLQFENLVGYLLLSTLIGENVPAFFAVPDAPEVYKIIRAQLDSMRGEGE